MFRFKLSKINKPPLSYQVHINPLIKTNFESNLQANLSECYMLETKESLPYEEGNFQLT